MKEETSFSSIPNNAHHAKSILCKEDLKPFKIIHHRIAFLGSLGPRPYSSLYAVDRTSREIPGADDL